MLKSLIALVLFSFAAVVSPAHAQTAPTTSAGTLTCQMAPSIGLIFGSRQRMACRFAPNGAYPPEAYVGVMGTIGNTATGFPRPIHSVQFRLRVSFEFQANSTAAGSAGAPPART
jgi:hypothetical protein